MAVAKLIREKGVVESLSMGIAADRVDETNHVVRGVKVIGLRSVKGYDYSPKAIAEAADKYNGARVYVGHNRNGRTGTYGERLGVLRNFTTKEGGGYADLHYNPHHPQAAQFVYDAKHNPEVLGLSHHADIAMARNKGRNVVESIDKVYSVDVVNVPATNESLFESEDDPMPKTLKQLIEGASADDRKELAVLEDMMSGGAMSPDMPVDAGEGSSVDVQMKAAFRAAIVAAFEDESLDTKSTMARIRNLLRAYDKTDGGTTDGGEGGDKGKGGGSGGSGGSTESVEQKLARLERRDEVRTLAAAEKVELSEVNLKAAVALESADDRKAFIKGLPKIAATESKSGPQKPARSGSAAATAMESADGAPPAFKTNEERLRFLRGN